MKTLVSSAALCAALVSVTGCNLSKSGNPLQPAAVQHVSPEPGPAAMPSLNGDEVVARVMARYPDRLKAGVSYDERVANMEFLRDRVVEEGRCAGLKLAWNLKRGTGPRSIDAITWRRGPDNILEVVDIALGYDDTGSALRLHWIIVDGPAGWDEGAETACPGA